MLFKSLSVFKSEAGDKGSISWKQVRNRKENSKFIQSH